MSAPAFDPALEELLDAGGIGQTSCDGTARMMLTEAALDYARSRGWIPTADALCLDCALKVTGKCRVCRGGGRLHIRHRIWVECEICKGTGVAT